MTKSSPSLSLAVIGGGASSALFAAALLHHKTSPITLDIYDRTGRFARGIAYATPHECHMLNVRAANMSGLQNNLSHFAEWAKIHGNYAAADFVPRRLYGDYLEGLLAEAQHHFPVMLHKKDVLSCTKNNDGYELAHAGGTARYDHVVLATGNVMPLGPAADENIAGYLANPWRLDETTLRGVNNIALIGTGLTAVDTILTLQKLGFGGPITLFSRRGLLPAVHTAPAVWPTPPLTVEDADKPLSHLLGLLRLHAREATAQDIPWQAVVDSLRPVTNTLWAHFTPAQQARFSRRLLTWWNIHRHRMAPSIAAQLDTLRQDGRLLWVRDTVRRIVPGPIIEGAAGAYPSDLVINCMGYRYREPGRRYDHTIAIGPARFGEKFFETTAIPEIRAQADEAARLLLPSR